MTNQYSIEVMQLSILGVAAHNFFVVRDLQTGNILTEIHGLATDNNGNINAVGTKNPLLSDQIKVYVFGDYFDDQGIDINNEIFNPNPSVVKLDGSSVYLQDSQPSETIFTGTYTEVSERIGFALKSGDYINSQNISYPWLGFLSLNNTNSNAANYTLAYSMGLSTPDFWRWEPGKGINLISNDIWSDQSLGLRYGLAQDNDVEYYLNPKGNLYPIYDPEMDIQYPIEFTENFTLDIKSYTPYPNIQADIQAVNIPIDEISYTDSNGNTTNYFGINSPVADFSDLTGLDTSGISEIYNNVNNMTYIEKDAQITVEGQQISFKSVVDMVEKGADNFIDFMSDVISKTGGYVENNANILISQIVARLIEGEDIEDIAQDIAVQTISAGAVEKLAVEIGEEFDILKDFQSDHAIATDAVKGAITAIAVTAILNGSEAGFEDYALAAANASVGRVINTGITNSGIESLSQEINGKLVPTPTGAGAIAALTTVASSLISGQGINEDTLRSAATSAGLAAASTAIANSLANTASFTQLGVGAGPIGIVVGAVLGIVVGNLFKSGGEKVYHNETLESITEIDANGNKVIIGVRETGVSLQTNSEASNLVGTNSDDVLKGDGVNNTILGQDGDDMLEGRDSQDALIAGSGNDFVEAGSGDDYVEGNEGNDDLRGDDGNDIILGGSGDDMISGWKGDDQIEGEDGNDVIYGDSGDDVILAGDGNDAIHGGAGNDLLSGEEGHDVIDGSIGDDELHGNAGDDLLFGDDGNDTAYGGSGNDILYGDDGVDVLYGDLGDDILDGGRDSDLLFGGLGKDVLFGQDGDDHLYGELNDDYIVGGKGDDQLDGGEGSDVYAFGIGDDIKKTMDYVRNFSFDKGLYGDGAANADLVGIKYPDGSVAGDESNVKLRFDDTYMKMAAEGRL